MNVSKVVTRFVRHSVKSLENTRRPPILGFHRCLASTGQLEMVKVERRGDKENIALLQLSRPKALNALCDLLIVDLDKALRDADDDDSIKCIVLTGSDRAFAAGADISEMQHKTYGEVYNLNYLAKDAWKSITDIRKPIIAAVNGYCLGGGCEIAMTCDVIYAGENAKFGQPEITIGTIPGAGGTQRLPKAIGKSKAMEMILTGDMMTAQEAESAGLVSKVFPTDQLVDEAVKMAEKIASHSPLIVKMAKEAINTSYDTTLRAGLHFEKRLFHASFATADQTEGMTAFVEKRPPKFTNS